MIKEESTQDRTTLGSFEIVSSSFNIRGSEGIKVLVRWSIRLSFIITPEKSIVPYDIIVDSPNQGGVTST